MAIQPKRLANIIILLALALFSRPALADQVVFTNNFAALEGWVKPVEQPYRQEICLNGSWQFQPVPIPAGYVRDQGVPPELPPPTANWESTPIKIPSPWNVNTYGCGRNVGAGTPHPYWPDSVCFPSYPASWDGVEMGWLKRSFRVPKDWDGKRLLLHFQAVAGGCQVLINGKPAGEHFDNFLPFELDITGQVNRGVDNELLVGVRHPHLYDKTHPVYPHERRTYADGSYLDCIVGIWQDVYLLGVPTVRVADVFVQPWVDRNQLVIETTLQNDSTEPQDVTVGGTASPWINEAGEDVISAPEPHWRLGDAVLTLPKMQVRVAAGATTTVVTKIAVGEQLNLWSPDHPNLYGLVLSVSDGDGLVDTRYQRFGWRQFKIQGKDLMLNGRKFQVASDILHPFGVFVQSRRHAWAWYRMLKDAGCNGVRLHAQPWPSYYQDLADEMGLVVLAEDGLFGSSLMLNFTDPVSWQRYTAHFDDMVRRDRNHPSVFGWSFGNELFAIFEYNHMSKEDTDASYAKLAELGRGAYKLDPTRQWISCDGDEDLRGATPVWTKHFGHGLSLDRLPDIDKPLMIGESGGTYYATPSQLSVFNGDRAYQSYAGRNEALGIDVYQNIAQMARPRLAYFSASELSWFGIEHLPLGYKDFTRLPALDDGVFFGPFVEGQPGMQPERIPPYCCTFNPGWDPSLPLYKPLAMFDAMKAAWAKGGPAPSPWDHLAPAPQLPAASPPTISVVSFEGDRSGQLFNRLSSYGVPFADDPADLTTGMMIIDGETLTHSQAASAKLALSALLVRGGTALVCFRQSDDSTDAVNDLLPAPVILTSRKATMLDRGASHPWTAPFSLANLYFAENPMDRQVIKCGIDGAFSSLGAVVLKGSDTDWSLFNNVPENAKCGAVVLYEHLAKPAGAALVDMQTGGGHLAISTIDYLPEERGYVALWRELLSNMGVKMNDTRGIWYLPVAPVKDVAWRYTTDAPPAGWTQSGFDESGWKTDVAGFGTDVPNNKTRTPWTSDDIWLRASFAAAQDLPGPLKLYVYHDDDAEIYLNGERIFAEKGYTINYKEIALPDGVAKRLKPAGNQIAVHCHQLSGGQYIDVGLARGLVLLEPQEKQEHDLLLNGPKLSSGAKNTGGGNN